MHTKYVQQGKLKNKRKIYTNKHFYNENLILLWRILVPVKELRLIPVRTFL